MAAIVEMYKKRNTLKNILYTGNSFRSSDLRVMSPAR